MVTKVVMPRLSLTMKTGTVVQWFKKEGEKVQKGEPIVEVLSEKITYDVEAPESGILQKILAEEGTDLPVAETIGIITAPNEQLSDTEVLTEPSRKEVDTVATAPKEQTMEKPEERIPASPAAKRLAREYGINLYQVIGTGPEGRIVEEDVKKLVEGTMIRPKVKEIIPLIGIRKTTAERLSRSFRTAPHSTVIMEVDMTNAAKQRERAQASYTEILVEAAAKALRRHPMMNATLEGEEIKVFEDINIGVAIATDKGLVVPVLKQVDKKSLNEISLSLKELVEKARQGELSREDMSGGTFTVTNLGMFDVDMFIPIINPPETGILGAGRVAEKPVVVNGQVSTRPVIQLSLAYDHRVVDGAPAAQFLRSVKQILESESNNIKAGN